MLGDNWTATIRQMARIIPPAGSKALGARRESIDASPALGNQEARKERIVESTRPDHDQCSGEADPHRAHRAKVCGLVRRVRPCLQSQPHGERNGPVGGQIKMVQRDQANEVIGKKCEDEATQRSPSRLELKVRSSQ